MAWLIPSLAALAALLAFHLWRRADWHRREQSLLGDIAGLRRSCDDARQQTRSQQELLLNSLVEGAILLDDQGRIRVANPACLALFGAAPEIRSRTVLEAFRLHELEDLVNALNQGQQVAGRELRITRPQERTLLVNGAAILDAPDHRQGAILLFHDLTPLKKLERTRQEFVANVSHELRTPLSLIKGYAETLLDGAKDNPEVATKFLETINRNAERLQRLMDDLLAISELESGRIKLNLQPIALRSLVDKCLADLRSVAEPRQVSFTNECPDLRVQADPYRLEQVLSNLLGNAIKYGRSPGTVIVRARQVDGIVETAVQDDGPGIPAEALDRVFERFFRVDKSRSREQGGTGLGLSIVKHIILSHGGKVWVESQLGKGATFFFTLPPAQG